MMNKEQCEAWTRLVDLSTSSRWFDGVILAADAELTELRQQRDELLAAANAARDMIAIERQFCSDCNVGFDGTFDPDSQDEINYYDAVLHKLYAAISKAEGCAA